MDPYAGMNDRQRKLYELRQRLQQCRKANQTAVVQEKKRQKVRPGNRGSAGEGRQKVRPVGGRLTEYLLGWLHAPPLKSMR